VRETIQKRWNEAARSPRAASALLSAEKRTVPLSIATAVSEAVALIEASSSEWPQITSEPMGRVPERRDASGGGCDGVILIALCKVGGTRFIICDLRGAARA